MRIGGGLSTRLRWLEKATLPAAWHHYAIILGANDQPFPDQARPDVPPSRVAVMWFCCGAIRYPRGVDHDEAIAEVNARLAAATTPEADPPGPAAPQLAAWDSVFARWVEEVGAELGPSERARW